MLSEYKVITEIYKKESVYILKGTRLEDNAPVIIKILNNAVHNAEDTALFIHEHQILSELAGLKTVPSVLDYFEEDNKIVIVLDDIEGVTIQHVLKNGPLPLMDFLHLSILITSALHDIHQKGFIHKDINPSNIVWNKEKNRINIIDFSISTKYLHEVIEYNYNNILQGTIAYMSPEQTGRMNRSIDFRSDYYSLGVLFYEMLTGQLPFISSDALELIHMHIAKSALPVHQVDNKIPEAISMIINKLMAKNAEERYQTTHGIIEDLKHCEREWNRNNVIQLFPIGTKDLSDRFEIPQKLYGRENEIKLLIESFNKACLGNSELSIVSGTMGIGKSAVIHEIHKSIIENNGYFLQGKFDQIQKSISALGLREIIQDLTKQILSESKKNISSWHNAILQAVSGNGAVLTNLAPDMALIIGEQPKLNAIDFNAAESRFFTVINNVIKVIANREHPIVIFIEDLQWADNITLKAIRNLVLDDSLKYIYIILSYRTNEVDEAHPFKLLLNAFVKAGVTFQSLFLEPLSVESVSNYIADIIHEQPKKIRDLANICHRNTGGNPFYLKHFLMRLYQQKLLYFDYKKNKWQWDLNAVQQHFMSENVMDILLMHLDTLDAKTKSTLSLAACIGNTFDLKTISYLLNSTQIEAAKILANALQENYIFPLSNNYLYATDIENTQASYRFSHDKMRELVYSLLSEEEKKEIQLKIGRFLLKVSPKLEIENNAPVIASYFFGNTDKIIPEEKYILAELNLNAGIKSKLTQSFDQAMEYFQIGISLLDESDWEAHYDLLLALYNETAESCSFLRLDEELTSYYNIINKHALATEDKFRINRIRIFYAMGKGNPYEAMNIGLAYLREFGIKYSLKPSLPRLIFTLIKTYIIDHKIKIETLADLPILTDKKIIALLQIMTDIYAPAVEISPELSIIIICDSFLMTIKHGIHDFSPFILIIYGVIFAGIFKKYSRGYDYAKSSLELYGKLSKKYYAISVCMLVFFFEYLTKKQVKI